MEDLLKILSDYGAPWVVVALEGFAIWRLFNLYVKTQNNRIEENKEAVQILNDNRHTQEMLTETIKAFMRGRQQENKGG